MAEALRHGVYRVHFAVACLVGAISLVFLSLLAVLLIPLIHRRAAVWFAKSFTGVMCAVAGWRIAVEGSEGLEAARPAVIVANHQSNLDLVTYGRLYHLGSVAIGKKEIAKIPGFGWLFAGTGQILLDRGNPQSARKSLAEAAGRIRNERLSVWVFPEGHRNQGAQLLPFKKGAFHLALAAQVPILPVVCEPIWTLLDAHRSLLRPGRLRFRVLQPIPTAGRTEADLEPLIAEVRTAMEAVRAELLATARERIS